MKDKDSQLFNVAIFALWFGYVLRNHFMPNIASKRKKSWKWRFQNYDGEMVGKQKVILNNNIFKKTI